MISRCSNCKNKVVQKSESGVKLRTQGAIVFKSDGQAYSQCYWCKSEVTLPIELTDAFQKSFSSESERLVIVERVNKQKIDK